MKGTCITIDLWWWTMSISFRCYLHQSKRFQTLLSNINFKTNYIFKSTIIKCKQIEFVAIGLRSFLWWCAWRRATRAVSRVRERRWWRAWRRMVRCLLRWSVVCGSCHTIRKVWFDLAMIFICFLIVIHWLFFFEICWN